MPKLESLVSALESRAKEQGGGGEPIEALTINYPKNTLMTTTSGPSSRLLAILNSCPQLYKLEMSLVFGPETQELLEVSQS